MRGDPSIVATVIPKEPVAVAPSSIVNGWAALASWSPGFRRVVSIVMVGGLPPPPPEKPVLTGLLSCKSLMVQGFVMLVPPDSHGIAKANAGEKNMAATAAHENAPRTVTECNI